MDEKNKHIIKYDDKEIWKNVKGYETKYKVSSHGRVKSITYNKIMNCVSLRSGYKSVGFGKKHFKIHRIVAITFIENNDKTKTAVNHKDGNKLNNHVNNLEWVSIKENNKHAYDIGLNKLTKRAVHQMDLEGNIIATFESMKEAKEKTGIPDSSISNVCKNKSSYAGGYKWEFVVKNPNEKDVDLTDFVKIKDHPKNMISKKGELYSTMFKKLMKQQINNDGYMTITLGSTEVGNKKTYLVHRLVAEHFIPKIEGKIYVNHKDSNKVNNNVDNLEWCTNGENIIHCNNNKKTNVVKNRN